MSSETSQNTSGTFRSLVEKRVIDISQKSILEVSRLIAVGGLVSFSLKDQELKSMIGELAKDAGHRVRTKKTDVGNAVLQAMSARVGLLESNKSKDEMRLDLIFGAVRKVTPHRLVESFQTHAEPSCIDVALMGHLVLERMGNHGSRVVVFKDALGAPTFALVYNNKILTYEKPKWVPVEHFRRARRINKEDDQLYNVYPTRVDVLLRSATQKVNSILATDR